MSGEQVTKLATEATARLGEVSDEEIFKRQLEDSNEAKQSVHDTLSHWLKFFENNAKYRIAGSVVYDEENSKEPPKLCGAALKKRPLKGGKLESLMSLGKGGAASGGHGKDHEPDLVSHQHGEVETDEDEYEKDEL